ncbi:MAG TPA: LytTR family DNA-binding domain-containing protein [Sediminibacterium sp.]|nr:LytTR family DNA-binding domain-containing protein [Sediminibacterium sp.]
MKKIRCIAIDDEPLALELLEDNISKVPYLELVASYSSALEAIPVLQQEPIDLIFLDIQMPGINGLQFIQSLTSKPMIILITAYEKYALEGFNLDVTDYLLKPVPLDRFIKACGKALELYQLKQKTKEGTSAVANGFFFVNVDYSMLKVVTADVVWVEGLKDYVKIHLAGTAKPIVTRMSMKNMEEHLVPPDFIRIHKSYIVSVKFITAIRKNSVFLNDLELPVSELYKDSIAHLTGKQTS